MSESKILEVRKNSQRYDYDSLQLHETRYGDKNK